MPPGQRNVVVIVGPSLPPLVLPPRAKRRLADDGRIEDLARVAFGVGDARLDQDRVAAHRSRGRGLLGRRLSGSNRDRSDIAAVVIAAGREANRREGQRRSEPSMKHPRHGAVTPVRYGFARRRWARSARERRTRPSDPAQTIETAASDGIQLRRVRRSRSPTGAWVGRQRGSQRAFCSGRTTACGNAPLLSWRPWGRCCEVASERLSVNPDVCPDIGSASAIGHA